ncbi:MAG: hydrolase [Bacteroidetes bacterium]|nr:MAG: hydrolase [Bacteroidota bacterium]
MKSKIFMYLFFFAILLIVFQYMNQKSIFESQEKTINSITESLQQRNDSIDSLHEEVADLRYFSLQGNDNAMTYLENLGLDAAEVENSITEDIYEKNLIKGGNPLIPLEGMDGEMRVNKLKFLNHRWIQVEITDGSYWGEMIIEYFYNDQMELELTAISSVLYPK